jgi:phosphoadenosine phosphosulfate reductase
MSEVRLGKIFLGWCSNCDLPVLSKRCGICDNEVSKIEITPPGDFRMAFPKEIERIESVIKKQFGIDLIKLRLSNPVLLNKIPDIDRMHEVIWKGQVAGALRYDIFSKREIFLPRVSFGQLLLDLGTDKYAIADDGAIESILKSSNLMVPGIVGTGEFSKGEEVLVADRSRNVIAAGNSRIDSETSEKRGMGIKIRVRKREKKIDYNNERERSFGESIDLMLEANRAHMDRKVKKSMGFIKKTIERHKKPVACSLSGGKDSLTTLLLLLDAGKKPIGLFVNTGLEFDETVEEVHKIAERFGIELIEKKARTDFWDDLEAFGNPSRDCRWCCKTRKLGPMVDLIEENFPDGVLTFIGQRRYESSNRAEHGSVWINPWIKKQIGASPIQNWNSMEVWLYLFSKNEHINPLYERGFERVGCWLCPASDLYDFVLYKHGDHDRYVEFLKRCYTDEAIELGLWRFRKLPKWAPDIQVKVN